MAELRQWYFACLALLKQQREQMGGVMYLTIVSASGLHNTETFGSMDTYVRIRKDGGQWIKTEVSRGTGTTPRWGKRFKIGFSGKDIQFQVLSTSMVGSDSNVAMAKIPFAALLDWSKGKALPLKRGKASGGSLFLDVQLETPEVVAGGNAVLVKPDQPVVQKPHDTSGDTTKKVVGGAAVVAGAGMLAGAGYLAAKNAGAIGSLLSSIF